jgi:hypothetical protein
MMDNVETQATLGKRHKTKQEKPMMDNVETQATLGKRHKTKQEKPMMDNVHRQHWVKDTKQNKPINIGVKREGQSVPVSYKTPVVLLIISSLIKERTNLRKREKIHNHLRYFVRDDDY